MFRSLALALADLGRPRILAIMLRAIAIAAFAFLLIAGGLTWALAESDLCELAGVGSCPTGLGGGAIGAIVVTLIAAWFLFPGVALAVIAGFTDRIATAVEQEHYPHAARLARPVGAGPGLLIGLKSGGRLILFNLIALPFYILLLVTGIGPFILFVTVNGIAFGRDVAAIAAARHGDRLSRREWLKSTRGQQHQIGLVISFLLLVPFVNFLAPVLGTAAGIHLFNGSFWSKADRGKAAPAPR